LSKGQFGMVPDVLNGNADGLERYFVYRMRMWMVWKGAWSTKWVVVSSCSNQLRTGSYELTPPRRICATTCPVCNGMLTNQGTLGMCFIQEQWGRVWLSLGSA
jgi:hypothetical protein